MAEIAAALQRAALKVDLKYIIPSMPGTVLSRILTQAGRNYPVSTLCRMRLQRLEELKTGSSEVQKAAAAYTLSDAALDMDVILDDAAQQRKRRKVDLKQILEPTAAELDGDESSEEDLELDWRAKTV